MNDKQVYIRFLIIALLCIFLGCGAKRKPQTEIPKNFFRPQTRTVIEPGDTLVIRFFYHPEINNVQTVRPDGKISLPFFQGLYVQGMTLEDLQKKLVALYSKYFVNPVITISFQTKATRTVFVAGEVTNGGEKSIPTNMTVAQILALSGVRIRSAALDSVILLRRNKNGYKVYKIDADFKSGKERDIFLAEGDILFVPRKTIVKLNDFIEQYIKNMIPSTMSLGLGFTYELHADN
ncbi:hypothetical protein JCM12298_19250 [Desulfothermus naphthae]